MFDFDNLPEPTFTDYIDMEVPFGDYADEE